MAIDDCNPTAPSPAQASGDRNDDGRAPQRPAASPQGSPASPRRRLPSATSSAGSPRSVRSSRIVPGQTPQRRPGPYPLPNRSSAAVAQDVLQTFGSEGEELPFDDPPISEKSDSMSLDHAELRRLLEIRETGSFEDFPKVKTARLKYAEERVIDARATLDGAQRTLDIAQRTLESVQRTVDSARAAKDSARKTLDIARTRLDSCLDLIETGQKPSPDAAPLEVRLRRAEERYNEARSDFSSAEARLDAAISYVKDADSKLNDALAERSLESEKVIAELNKRIEALEKKLGWYSVHVLDRSLTFW
ncbi:hypothetical protein DFJ73DRAFT_516062 [Zopfochytrium polystomum]|nr:hypothetical protein DFJ73DRAFT_516062 [Zopfochytrium polystomum]